VGELEVLLDQCSEITREEERVRGLSQEEKKEVVDDEKGKGEEGV